MVKSPAQFVKVALAIPFFVRYDVRTEQGCWVFPAETVRIEAPVPFYLIRVMPAEGVPIRYLFFSHVRDRVADFLLEGFFMKSKQTTRTLCEGAIMVAMAVVLNFFKFDLFAQGGSMNLLFIPLMVFALRRGPVWGMGAGLVFGVLKAIIGGGIAYGWQSLLLDYALAYALTGLAGFTPKKPVLGTVIGALGALLSFVLSGVFVWGEYMPDVFLGMAMKNVWIYSFIYNFIYTAFNWLIAAIVIYFLSKKTKLLQPEK